MFAPYWRIVLAPEISESEMNLIRKATVEADRPYGLDDIPEIGAKNNPRVKIPPSSPEPRRTERPRIRDYDNQRARPYRGLSRRKDPLAIPRAIKAKDFGSLAGAAEIATADAATIAKLKAARVRS